MVLALGAARPSTGQRESLGRRFDPRRNHFDVMRLLLAGMVLLDHGVVLRTGDHRTWGRSALGDFAVDAFFLLSGFLITRSYLSLGSLPRFTWHRVLRILPGFWVCLLVTALVVAPVAALLDGRPATDAFTGRPSALRYVLANAGLLITQYDIAGLLADNPVPAVFDGALWTLSLEAACYALVGVLGALSVLRRARWAVPALALVLWVLTLLQEAGVPVVLGDNTLRLVLAFLVGATAWLYADRIPARPELALAAAVVLLVSIATLDNYRLAGMVPAGYLLFWLGTAAPLARGSRPSRGPRADLSYGVYIYHWPVLQLLAVTGLVALPVPVFVLLGAVLTLAVALASWRLVEHPALRQKNRSLPRPRRPAPQRAAPDREV